MESEKKKINFYLKVELTNKNTYQLKYGGNTPEDQNMIDINQYGSGVRGMDPKKGGLFNLIRSTNRVLNTIRFSSDWNTDDK
jgi:hypothetical protein